MQRAGQHAEFIDRCTALSVADRLMMKKLQQLPMNSRQRGSTRLGRQRERSADEQTPIPATTSIAAE